MKCWAASLLALLSVTAFPPQARAALHAERITAERHARLRVGGPDADAGVGDWALGNGTLCAAISDPSHEAPLSVQGGVLVDLGHCGRDNDQWSVLQPLLNLGRERLVPSDRLRASVDDGEARIVAEGVRDGIRAHTRYTLGLEAPTELRITTRITRDSPGDRVFALGDVALHSDGQLRAFSLSLRHPERSGGFAHPPVDVGSPLAMARAMVTADVHVLVGADSGVPGIAYGLWLREAQLERADGSHATLPTVSITGGDFTLFGAFTRPFWLGAGDPPGLLELSQSLLMDLAPGDSVILERSLRVGDRADVASLTDQLWPEAARVVGTVDDPAARLHFERDGAPVTERRPDEDGRFSLRLPPGRYRVKARAPGGREASRDLEVGHAARVDLGRLVVGTPSTVRLPRGQSMRLVFRGLGNTPDPRFGDDLLGFRVAEREIPPSPLSHAVSLAGGKGDPTSVTLAPGRYRVLASRGLEFGVSRVEIEVEAGRSLDLAIPAPNRVLDSPGWISADLHVHSGESFDSSLPLAAQLRAFAAQEAEVLVSTEHDRIIDPAPELRRLDLEGRVVGLSGVEVTTTVQGGETPHTIGHLNAFPLRFRPRAYRGGAPAAEGRRVRSLLASLRAERSAPLVQLNHPRSASGRLSGLHYFTHLAVAGEPFEPTRPLSDLPNRVLLEKDPEHGVRDLDFDLIELMNGPNASRYRLTRADWLSLLLQGERHTATANSDSHHAFEVVAIPRTYVRLGDDRVEGFQEDAFFDSLRAGRVFGTSGPLLSAELEGTELGGLFQGRSGRLRLSVRAAPWVPVSEARVFVNGRLVERRPVGRNEVMEMPLRFEADAFVTVEVVGVADETYAAIAPRFTPLAFTNPIFVDADGDGRFSAPGLTDPLPEAIRAPLVH